MCWGIGGGESGPQGGLGGLVDPIEGEDVQGMGPCGKKLCVATRPSGEGRWDKDGQLLSVRQVVDLAGNCQNSLGGR